MDYILLGILVIIVFVYFISMITLMIEKKPKRKTNGLLLLVDKSTRTSQWIDSQTGKPVSYPYKKV